MDDAKLRNLLERADMPLAADPAVGRRIAERVRTRYGRRQRLRLILGAATVLLIGGALWHVLPMNGRIQVAQDKSTLPDRPVTPPVSEAVADQRVSAALARMEYEMQAVEQLLSAERAGRLVEKADDLTRRRQAAIPNEQIELAAATVLWTADQRATSDVTAARAEYESVISLFPNTACAERAHERLAALME